MAKWPRRQMLISRPISLISGSLLLYHALLLLYAAPLPPAPAPFSGPLPCSARPNGTICHAGNVSVSFPFVVADECDYDDHLNFYISDCNATSEHPHWPGLDSYTHLNGASVLGMSSPRNACSDHEITSQNSSLNPCYGYINLTWSSNQVVKQIGSNCNLALLDQMLDPVPDSFDLENFAHSAFNFTTSNILLVCGCNTTQVSNPTLHDLLQHDTPACKQYTQECGQQNSCYQYNLTSKKLPSLHQVMSSSGCKQAMFFVADDTFLPVSQWQPGVIQLTWNPGGTDWLGSTMQKCAGCLLTSGSCGYDSNNNFQCLCGNNRATNTSCSEGVSAPGSASSSPHHSPTAISSGRPHNYKWLKIFIGVAGSLALAVFMSLALIALLYLRKRRKAGTKDSLSSIQYPWLKRPSFLSRKQDPVFLQEISYEELVRATDAFADKNILGDGGFGAVYKGVLANALKVAVKRLHHDNYRRMEHFYNEMKVLSNLNHPNLVKLFAFCACEDKKELLLVFEYASQGTVSDHLHNGLEPQLSWSRRLNIACETAAALSYLHNAVDPPIYHRDVKTTNILLDENFHAKLADFGLSKLVPLRATHVSTAPQGTPGYLDPEYHECYQLTDKSDVYSLGVVLVELTSAKLAVDMSRDRGEINLSTFAMVKIQCGLTEELVDPALEVKKNPNVEKSIKRVIELAFACLQGCRDDRPSMEDVAVALANIRREYEETCLNMCVHSRDAISTPTQKHSRSPPSVFFSSDSSYPSSNVSSA